MKDDISPRIKREISGIALANDADRVILFGSRARGTHTEKSDIDIAVCGGDYMSFCNDIDDNVHTLLMFDIIDLNNCKSEDLKEEINKDGVVIYEKAG